jgi:hypothetical protein
MVQQNLLWHDFVAVSLSMVSGQGSLDIPGKMGW